MLHQEEYVSSAVVGYKHYFRRVIFVEREHGPFLLSSFVNETYFYVKSILDITDAEIVNDWNVRISQMLRKHLKTRLIEN